MATELTEEEMRELGEADVGGFPDLTVDDFKHEWKQFERTAAGDDEELAREGAGAAAVSR